MIRMNSRTILSSILAAFMLTSFSVEIFAQPGMGAQFESARQEKRPGIPVIPVSPEAAPSPAPPSEPSGDIFRGGDMPLAMPEPQSTPEGDVDSAAYENYMQTAQLNIKLSLWEQQKQHLTSLLAQIDQMKTTFDSMSAKGDAVSAAIGSLLAAIRNTGNTGNAPPPGVDLITEDQLNFYDSKYASLAADFNASKAPLSQAINEARSTVLDLLDDASSTVSAIQAGIANGGVAPSNFPDPNPNDMSQAWMAVTEAGVKMGEWHARGELIRFGISLHQRVAHIISAYETAQLSLTAGQLAVKNAAEALRLRLLDIV